MDRRTNEQHHNLQVCLVENNIDSCNLNTLNNELQHCQISLTCLVQDEQELGADSDEDISCYDDDFSVGIDLPMAAETSGNVTPIPTTGELEELRSVFCFYLHYCDIKVGAEV